MIEGLPFSAMPLAMATIAQRAGQNGVLAAQYDAVGEAVTVLGLIEALSCSNVGTETIRANPAINAKRVRRGKLPLYTFHTLVVDVPIAARSSQPGGGHHRSPRQHLRRGHVRHLASGKRTWVSACVVGAATAGTVGKGYAVRSTVA